MDAQSRKDHLEHMEIPLSERLKSIPGFFGIRLGHEPYYTIVKSDGPFEIRRYDPMTIASLIVSGTYEHALEEGFLRLADYIFGKNHLETEARMNTALVQSKHHEQMEMMAPVFQEKTDAGWKISFVLPKEYTLKNAPIPEDSEIILEREPTRMVATYKYSGTNDDQVIDEKSKELYQWFQSHPDYKPISNIRSAEYDGPLTVPFLRRNEVLVRVERIYTH